MRIEKFGSLENIVTAVYYTWTKGSVLYPPEWNVDSEHSVDLSIVPEASKIEYKSSSNSIKLKDFKEYSYKYFPKKGKYGDFDILDLYGDETRELIGTNPSDIEKISTFAVPSIYTNEKVDTSEIGYFKTKVLSGGRVVCQLAAPEGCYKIELYTEALDMNGSNGNCVNGKILAAEYDNKIRLSFTKKPVISIFLGPEKDNILNPASFYYKGNIDVTRTPGIITVKEYRKLLEEIVCSKVVTIVSVSGEVENFTINTVQDSFYESHDPLRNLSDLVLRNDEWYGSKDSISQVGVRRGSLYDLGTGTLLGNKITSSTPILDSKKKLLSQIRGYSQDHTYNRGDVVVVGKTKYVSVADNNKGNQPLVSSEWILETDFLDTFTKIINVFVLPTEGGVSSKAYLIYDGGKSKTLEFTPGYGFEFKWDESRGLGNSRLTNGEEQLILGEDFKYVELLDDKTGKLSRFITILKWEKLLETEKLFICPVENNKEVEIRLLYNNLYYYLDNNKNPKLSKFPEESQKYSYKDIYFNGQPISGKELLTSLSATSELTKIGTQNLETLYLSVSGVEASYTYSDLTTSTELLPEVEDNVFEDNVISSKVTYTILVKDREYRCKVYFNTEKWEVEDSCPIAYYEKPLSVRFYPIQNTTSLKNIELYHQDGGEWVKFHTYLPGDDVFTEEDGIVTLTIPGNLVTNELKIFINVNE